MKCNEPFESRITVNRAAAVIHLVEICATQTLMQALSIRRESYDLLLYSCFGLVPDKCLSVSCGNRNVMTQQQVLVLEMRKQLLNNTFALRLFSLAVAARVDDLVGASIPKYKQEELGDSCNRVVHSKNPATPLRHRRKNCAMKNSRIKLRNTDV
jgi:hypothetical protein